MGRGLQITQAKKTRRATLDETKSLDPCMLFAHTQIDGYLAERRFTGWPEIEKVKKSDFALARQFLRERKASQDRKTLR